MRKVFLVFIFIFFNSFSTAQESLKYIELKDLNSLNSQENIVRVVKVNGALIKLKTENIEKVFFYPPKRFITKATYTGMYNQKISHNNSKFMEDWLESKYLEKKELNTEDDYINTTLTTLNTQQFNLFYDEVVLLSNGKRYNYLIQKNASEKLSQDKGNKDYIFEFIVLGYDKSTSETYVVITNYSEVDNTKNYNNYEIMESDHINARKASESKQYDYALSKMENLLKKYPDNIEYKQDYCNIMLTKSFRTNSKISDDIIMCYDNILKQQNSPEVNYILATIYYNDDSKSLTFRNKMVIRYTTNAIDAINTKGSKITPRESEVYHNSLYLRGIAKINSKDSSGYNDLRLLQKERPDLVFNGIFNK